MRIVHSLDELLDCATDGSVNGLRRRELLQLEIPSLARPAAYRAQAALNNLQARCGSTSGAGVMFLSLIGGVIAMFYRHGPTMSWALVWEGAAVLVLSLALGFVAKTSCQAVTRWQFERACRRQYQNLSDLMLREIRNS